MTTNRYDLVVIGGGPAGMAAAGHARKYGASVLLVEQGDLGGVCVNDGCVPTRTLARAARLIREAHQFSEFGLKGSVPVIDVGVAIARARRSMELVRANKYSLGAPQLAGVEFIVGQGPASFTGLRQLRVADRTIDAGKVLICAGGRARRLPIPGAELALVHSDIWDFEALPTSAVVVGAASTGCQVASILAAFGVGVTLIDTAPRILASEDEDVSIAITAEFQTRSIEVITGIDGVTALERIAGDGLRVTLISRGAVLTREVGAVVLAVGWEGALESLNLPAAGIATERGFITVDDEQRTTNPDVYVAGDIDGHMMLVQSAELEARLAVENALGYGPPHRLGDAHRIVPHGGFTDPEYASVGITEAAARLGGDIAVATVPYRQLDRALIDGCPDGFVKLIVAAEDHRILGAHVVGEQAVEAIHIVAAAMSAGLPVESVAAIQFAYPTFTACIGQAARSAEQLLVNRENHARDDVPSSVPA